MLVRLSVTVLVAAVLGGAAAPAVAVHWPQQGGDPGRSGYQPVGDGAPPVRPLWSLPGDVVAAPLITAGSLAEQRVVYGTADGRVHLRDLAGGGERGQAGGTRIDDTLASGAFGEGGGVAFAESSGNGGLGAVFAVHNADNRQPFFGGLDDVEVAVVDEATGDVVEDVPVSGTVDHRVEGPAALSPPDAAGARSLLFLAQAPGGAVSLVRIPVDGSRRLGSPQAVAVPGADPRGGATIVYLRAGAGAAEPYAAVGAGDGVRTFSLARFPAEGPRSKQEAGTYGTPAAPVATAGLAPGQPGSGAASAPGLYVAATAGGMTRVHRLEEAGGELAVRASSPPLPGAAAPGVAAAQEVVAGEPVAGWVVAGTTQGLHVLDARSLQSNGTIDGSYAQAVPAAVGRLAFVTPDGGDIAVVDLGAVRALDGDTFERYADATGPLRPAGQPAVSRGIAVFAGDRGVYAFRTRCGNPVAGTTRADRLQAGVPGDAIAGYAGADALGGGTGDDCIDGGEGADRLRGDDGEDTLGGGDGNDFLSGDAGHDILEGGPGRDRIAGGAGADRMAGGDGADRLDGGSFSDVMAGGAGRDLLLGGDGNDRIAGGAGDDRVDAGPGNDAIDVRGGGRDRVRCGSGRDTVRADRRDRLVGDCETRRR